VETISSNSRSNSSSYNNNNNSSRGLSPQNLNNAAEDYFAEPTPENKEALCAAAKGLIMHFAALYGGGCRFEDLLQSGMEGLLKAAGRYNPHRGASFATFASHCIMGEIRHYVRKEASYYTPGCIAGLQSRVSRFLEEYLASCETIPPIAEVAENLGVEEESLVRIMNAGLVNLAEIDDKNIPPSPYQSFHLYIEDKLFLEYAFKKLDDLQRKVIHMLFYYDLTQSQTAQQLGLSQRQVSRIKVKSMGIMRGELG